MVQVEFFQRLVFGGQLARLRVDVLGDREHHENNQRERDAVDGRVFLREQIRDGDETQNQGRNAQAHRDLHAARRKLNGNLYS